MNDIKEQAKKMVQDLLRLKKDKAAMSALRKGLSEALEYKTFKYLSRWCNLEKERDRTIIKHVAAFYAMHPEMVSGKNFGQSLRELALKRDPIKGEELHERYLKRLLGARDSTSLCGRLAFTMRMIKNLGIPVDYEKLYIDIFYWGERTKISWACSYYGEKEVSDVSDKNNS